MKPHEGGVFCLAQSASVFRKRRSPSPPRCGTIADVIAHLAGRGENYAYAFEKPGVIRAALDRKHAPLQAELAGARELALFPPMTGG